MKDGESLISERVNVCRNFLIFTIIYLVIDLLLVGVATISTATNLLSLLVVFCSKHVVNGSNSHTAMGISVDTATMVAWLLLQ